MAVLDKTGLEHLWAHIVLKLNGKASVETVNDIVNGITVVGKATHDASGNVITTTYATKSELSEVIIYDGSID